MQKINFLPLGAGILMIIFSVLNYVMNKDHVSLGIFIFSGIGFILLSLKDRFEEKKANRLKKYAMTFFFAAIIIFVYWLAAGKFELL